VRECRQIGKDLLSSVNVSASKSDNEVGSGDRPVFTLG
jgi:hypothetical protein